MPASHSDTDRFSLLLDALRPWLGRVVFIGGWAHRLYRERPEAVAPPYDALRTEDADIALAPGTIARTEDLRGRLIARGSPPGAWRGLMVDIWSCHAVLAGVRSLAELSG
jgi:hypothetical protein